MLGLLAKTGKSTTVSMLCGFAAADAGSAAFDDGARQQTGAPMNSSAASAWCQDIATLRGTALRVRTSSRSVRCMAD